MTAPAKPTVQYALESAAEFDRLERQSQLDKYDFRKELIEFEMLANGTVLDAGCGSGIVSRYLATEKCPSSKVVGCDMSSERVRGAREAAAGISNIQFQTEHLEKLTFVDNTFDAIVCRYVLEHLHLSTRTRVMSEFFRVLRPGGRLYAIDFDGPVLNIFPQTSVMKEVIDKVTASDLIDLHVGRKMPHLMGQAGFSELSWRIETIQGHGECLEQERVLWPPKLALATDLFTQIIGDREKVLQFNADFSETMKRKDVVLFYNKFTAIGSKPTAPLPKVSVVKS